MSMKPPRCWPCRNVWRHGGVAALLAAAAASAAAADWRQVEPAPPDRLVPERLHRGADGALWIVSSDGVRRTSGDTTRLLRRSASGVAVPADAVRELVPLADGGVLLDVSGIRGDVGGLCAVERIRLDGQASWRAELPLRDESCRGFFANAAGQSWVFGGEQLFSLDADGRIGARPANVGQPYWTRPAVVLDDGSIVSATRLRGVSTSRLARFDTQGNERWHWVREDQKTLAFVTRAGDGIVAVALDGDGVGTYGHDLTRWSTDGRLLWTHVLPPRAQVADVIAASGGDVYAVFGDSTFAMRTLQRIGADGSLRWQVELGCAVAARDRLPLTRTADDGIVAVCGSGAVEALLVRVSSAGTVASLPLPLDTATQVLEQGDATLLVLGRLLAYPYRPTWRTLLVDGTTVTTAPLDEFRDTPNGHLLGQQMLPDGSTVIATAADGVDPLSPGFVIARYAATGRLMWRTRVGEPPYLGRDGLAADDGIVCAALDSAATRIDRGGMDGLACLHTERGDILWTATYAAEGRFGALSIGSDGKIRTLRSGVSDHELQRFGRDGRVEASLRYPQQARRAVFDRRGAATVTTGETLRQYTSDGQPHLTFPQSGAAVWLNFLDGGDLLSADDGSTWLLGRPFPTTGTHWRLWAIAPDGRTRWTRDLGNEQPTRLYLDGDALYGVGPREGSTGSDRSVEIVVQRFDALRGDLRWSQSGRHHPFTMRGSALAISPDRHSVGLVHAEFGRLHLERLAASDGQRLHEAFVACDRLCGVPAAVSLDDAGTARVALDVLDAQRGQAGAVIAADLSASTTRLDQPGIAGAWWSPYANGEGITFDWLPASRTLFGAWFTYSTTGGNEPSELRWYTVQANGVGDGARTLDLPILETAGGNFDAVPAVSPRRIGTARLEFHDCTRGTLRYAFDAAVNDGRSGTITLSRLSPATQPCVLADGSSVPALATPPANGFDARLSGTWFDDATAGQGLQFTVQPGGVFFAPWFTFDPAGTANDAGRQHWFTLQGNLADARNGSAELVLVQTLGGRFDAVPTYNANRIGLATLRVLGCDRAELDYRFDDTSTAHAFRARSGTLRLSRAGGCAN